MVLTHEKVTSYYRHSIACTPVLHNPWNFEKFVSYLNGTLKNDVSPIYILLLLTVACVHIPLFYTSKLNCPLMNDVSTHKSIFVVDFNQMIEPDSSPCGIMPCLRASQHNRGSPYGLLHFIFTYQSGERRTPHIFLGSGPGADSWILI
jgi:hypothetical protein